MKTVDLSELISAGESETVEFKQAFGDEALEAIGSFSNMRGGILLIGVSDSGETYGVQIGKKTLEDIANRIQDATDPRLQPSISTLRHGKKAVDVILGERYRGKLGIGWLGLKRQEPLRTVQLRAQIA
jgi:ATP-dependent DNA helicase RecG